MTPLHAANLALRFALELAAVAAAAGWGVHHGDGLPAQLGWAVAAATAVVLTWGVFVSPKARVPLPGPARLAVELAVFGAATVALAVAAPAAVAVLFAAAVLVHETGRAVHARSARRPAVRT